MRVLTALLAAALLAGCASVDTAPAVTRDDVVALAKAGADAQWIIDRLRETGTVLALSAGDILAMHRDGVPKEVLDWMQAEQIAEIRRRDAMFGHMGGSPFYRCPFPPQRVFHPRFGWHYAPWPGC